ncbi:DUF1804 family protein [Campylobacter corcagiensis]|uniref:DUF1804 family protein n=1 Tax=Campylobacter corcagiensis TaxID=1448857 RepID=A0A7M1LFC1_9BACT|nr:DUF1804 family protein [Campylobacter corcagiensis]QKF64568.1 DUF1804 domain-containing protein [Campylobacter corcagiensis]QOQ87258.1 DUF1804 family protein [Campylobacter corcagiensis]
MSSTKELARELYLKGFNISKIAQILHKSPKTIQNYKSRDGNWDMIKATDAILNAKNSGETIYNSFIDQMYQAIKDITDDDKLSSIEKANALSKVGDSFAKMKYIAKLEDPASYKLSIVKEVIKLIVEHFKSSGDDKSLQNLVLLLDSAEFNKKIENLNAI